MSKLIKIINDCGLPKPVYDAMSVNNYKPIGFVGPSSLKQGIRQVLGRKRFPECDRLLSREWRTFTGTLVHLGMEQLLKDKPEYEMEVELKTEVNKVMKHFQLKEDIEIGGTCDLLHTDSNGKVTLFDYKTMATAQIITDDKILGWEQQLNIYRWLLIVTGKVQRIEKMYVCGFFIDWTVTKALRSHDINDIPCPLIEIRMWDRKEIEQFLYERLSDLQKYKDAEWDDIPYCTAEERWEGEPIFKVCKVKDGVYGNQLPGCGFTTIEAAEDCKRDKELKEKKDTIYGIKKTGGIPVMCENWCDLSRNNNCDYLKRRNEL